MTIVEAKRILIAWRPGRRDADDPQIAEALALAHREPPLKQWLEKHRAFQRTTARSFQEIPVPANLREKILARSKIVRPPAWQGRPAVLMMAAALVLFLGLAVWWQDAPSEFSLPTFRSRMVNTVLRQYTMDIVTNDMTQVRMFLAAGKAPSDILLPEKLAKLPVSGAGILSWRDQRVSMVCLESPNRDTLFLFVVSRTALNNSPTGRREFEQVNKLMTASWTQGERIYVLAGSGGREMLEKLF